MTKQLLKPEEVLPHRPPFLFVDEILALQPGESAKASWHLSADEAFFAGHFPNRPTLPGVLICEAIAQVGALAVMTDPRYRHKLPLFGGINSARFRRQVVPGETLIMEAQMTRLSARAGKGVGQANVAGELAASCELMFVIVDSSET